MNISTNKYGFGTLVISLICLIVTTTFLIIVWRDIPEIVPGHYNFAGEVDGTTGKSSLIPLLGLAWVSFAGMTILMRFPRVWNAGVTVTEENRGRIYRILRNMLSTARLLVVLLFCLIVARSTTVISLPNILFPAVTILLLASMPFFLVRLFRAR